MGERIYKVVGRLAKIHGNKKPPLTYNGENDVSTFFAVAFDPIPFILACNENMHKISDKFKFRPERTTDYGVNCH